MTNTRPGSVRRIAAVVLGASVLAGFMAGCASLERNPGVVGTFSDRLSPYNYKEEGALVRLVAGVEAARFIRKEPYFPLFVQVTNKSKTVLEITREAFTLEDSLGRQYAIVPARDLAENYRRADLDRRMFRQNRAITLPGIGMYPYVPSDFYPSNTRRSLLQDNVSLPPLTFMEDVLYFPIPETGLNGVPLRLLFKVKPLEEPIEVVFEVPKTLGILEKDEEAP
jgi:hypothetical protein